VTYVVTPIKLEGMKMTNPITKEEKDAHNRLRRLKRRMAEVAHITHGDPAREKVFLDFYNSPEGYACTGYGRDQMEEIFAELGALPKAKK
jgi:hypothetical protein